MKGKKVRSGVFMHPRTIVGWEFEDSDGGAVQSNKKLKE